MSNRSIKSRPSRISKNLYEANFFEKMVLKIISVFILAILCNVSSVGQNTVDNSSIATQDAPHLQLDSAYIDMGVILRDSIGEATMHFCNTGDAPLQIMRIFSECGCTVPSYSTDDVLPGEKGEIKIRFNGKNRNPGSFRKALRIRSNADNSREILIVKGRIK